TNPGPQTTSEGQTVSLPIGGNDPDGDPLTFSATNLPPGLSINPTTGLITGVSPFTTVTHPATQRAFSVTVTASDGTLSSRVTFIWTVLDVDQPPVVTSPGPQTASEGQSVSLSVTASDPDGDSLTFSASNLPPGLSINPTSGLITGTIPFTTVTHPDTQRAFS